MITGAGGGVGVFAVQLAVRTGARVIALASERHHVWLRERGAVPVAYGDGVSERITAAAKEMPVAAFIDLVGGGYVQVALELGIARDRIDTIATGDIVVPIQRTYPLDDVRAAFTELEAGHIAGKIVLIP